MDWTRFSNIMVSHRKLKLYHRSIRFKQSEQSLANFLPILMAECFCFLEHLYSWWYTLFGAGLERVKWLFTVSYWHEIWVWKRKSIWFWHGICTRLCRFIPILIFRLDCSQFMASLEILRFHLYHMGTCTSLCFHILKMSSKGTLKMFYICFLWSLDKDVFDSVFIHSYSSSNWYLLARILRSRKHCKLSNCLILPISMRNGSNNNLLHVLYI